MAIQVGMTLTMDNFRITTGGPEGWEYPCNIDVYIPLFGTLHVGCTETPYIPGGVATVISEDAYHTFFISPAIVGLSGHFYTDDGGSGVTGSSGGGIVDADNLDVVYANGGILAKSDGWGTPISVPVQWNSKYRDKPYETTTRIKVNS